MSLVGALTHLGKVPKKHQLWIQSVIAYTCAGALSACAVGALLGVVGRWVGRLLPIGVQFFLAGLLSLALVLREVGWFKFPLPVSQRQTKQTWAHSFGFRTAAVMWGLHIDRKSTRLNSS